MTANAPATVAASETTTMAFRVESAVRDKLEAIGKFEQHADLSETLRTAVAEYIARWAPGRGE